MQRKTLADAECPIARSLERVGEWWSILIMRDALHGLRRFDEFSRSLDIAPNMLTRRLNSLVEDGLLERRAYSERPLRHEYVPTVKGEDFAGVLLALVAFYEHHVPQSQRNKVLDAQVLDLLGQLQREQFVPTAHQALAPALAQAPRGHRCGTRHSGSLG